MVAEGGRGTENFAAHLGTALSEPLTSVPTAPHHPTSLPGPADRLSFLAEIVTLHLSDLLKTSSNLQLECALCKDNLMS